MSWDDAIAKVLTHEGGYVNNPNDKGGETNYGITITTARANQYVGPMKALPLDTAKEIYKKNYWDTLQLDAITQISSDIAMEVFDGAVNCGTRRAGAWFQAAVGLLADLPLKTDGIIGKDTIAVFKILKPSDMPILLKLLIIMRGSYYVVAVKDNPTQKQFLRGWINRLHA